jgi:hypothetical protein
LSSAYLLLFNLLDGSDSVVWINNLLADFEAHRSTSIEFEKSDCAARAGLGEIRATQDSAGPYLESDSSLATALAQRQAIHRATPASENTDRVFQFYALTFND